MAKPPSAPDQIRAVSELTRAEVQDAKESYSPQQIREDRPLRFFVSYAHKDDKLKAD